MRQLFEQILQVSSPPGIVVENSAKIGCDVVVVLVVNNIICRTECIKTATVAIALFGRIRDDEIQAT